MRRGWLWVIGGLSQSRWGVTEPSLLHRQRYYVQAWVCVSLCVPVCVFLLSFAWVIVCRCFCECGWPAFYRLASAPWWQRLRMGQLGWTHVLQSWRKDGIPGGSLVTIMHTLHKHETFSLSTYVFIVSMLTLCLPLPPLSLSLSPLLSLPPSLSFSLSLPSLPPSLPWLKHSLSAQITVACCLTLYSGPAWQAKSEGVFFSIHALLLLFIFSFSILVSSSRLELSDVRCFQMSSGSISSINHN